MSADRFLPDGFHRTTGVAYIDSAGPLSRVGAGVRVIPSLGRPLTGFNRPGSRLDRLRSYLSSVVRPGERTAVVYPGIVYLTVMISISHVEVIMRAAIPLPSTDFVLLFK